MSDEKTTVEIAAVPDWAVKLTEKVVGGFGAMTTRLDKQDEVLERVANESIDTNTRLVKVELRLESAERKVGDIEERLGRTSTGVKGLSTSDAEQAAQLAQERAAREELAKKVDGLTATQDMQLAILSRLDRVASNPTVKVIAGMVATALLTWLASHGGSLK